MIILGTLGLLGLLEVVGGIIAMLYAQSVLIEIEGTVSIGFGILTLAVVNGVAEIRLAINRLRADLAKVPPEQ